MASLNDVSNKVSQKLDKYVDERGMIGIFNSGVGFGMGASNEFNFKMINGGNLHINYSTDSDAKPITGFIIDNGNRQPTGSITCGEVTATKVYNAVWNDYAEFYERGEYTEAGDIIGLNPNSNKEEYIKATNPSMCVGVHSDEYGHLIGGEQAPEGKDFVEYNMNKFIPVGLVGRVKTKIIGKISIGDKIVLSDIPGVGRKFIKGIDDSENIIGMAVENKTDESISRIRAHLRMGGGTNPQFYWI